MNRRARITTSGSCDFCSISSSLLRAESCFAKKISSRTIALYFAASMNGVCFHSRRAFCSTADASAKSRLRFNAEFPGFGSRVNTCPVQRKPMTRSPRRIGTAVSVKPNGHSTERGYLLANSAIRPWVWRHSEQELLRSARKAQNPFSFVVPCARLLCFENCYGCFEHSVRIQVNAVEPALQYPPAFGIRFVVALTWTFSFSGTVETTISAAASKFSSAVLIIRS